MSKLTLKQQLFVKHYLLERNATKAAKAAGYAPESADVEGARLLVNAKVKAEIDKRLRKVFGDLDISAEWVLRELRYLAGANMLDYVKVQGRDAYLDLSEVTREQGLCIGELTSDVLLQAGGGEDSDPVEIKRTKIKLAGKLQALELLAKYFKLLTDKVEHTDADGDNVRVLWIGEKKRDDTSQ